MPRDLESSASISVANASLLRYIRRIARTGGIYLGIALFLVFVLIPVFWMLSTSLRPLNEIYRVPPVWISKLSSFDPYVKMWKARPFSSYLLNTIFVSGVSTVISAVIANFAAYGFSRFRFKGANALLSLILATQMFPIIMLVIPYFRMMVYMGLIDSYLGLIVAYISFTLPFCTWTLKGFYDSIPKELDESALIDGCSRLQAFFRVIMPLCRPGIATTIMFAFLVAWNHYVFAMILITSPDKYVMAVAIPSLISQYQIHWNELMAAATIAVIPPIFAYTLVQKHFLRGLTAGAVKG